LFPTGLAVTIAVPISTSGNSNLLIGAGYRNTGWISSPFKPKMIAIAAANMPKEIKDAQATRDDWEGRASPKSSASAACAASLGLADDLSM
jgi:hypothetical protein